MKDRRTAAPDVAPDAISAEPDDFERSTMPHLCAVESFARSLTRDPARAEDLVQETYLQALRQWHAFHDGADPKRWLLSICHRTYLRTIGREARHVDAPDDDPELESLAAADAYWHAQRSGILEIAERMELGPVIDRALGSLPVHYRCPVVLVDVEGQSYEETAIILEVAVGTVRSRLFRGRRLVQDLLFEYARDAGLATAQLAGPPPSHTIADRATASCLSRGNRE